MDESNNDNVMFNTLPNEIDNDKETNDGIDELVICYFFTICSCPLIIFITVFIIYLPIFFLFGSTAQYKRVVQVDKKNKVMIVCDKPIISCCTLNPKTYILTTIKKIRIYISYGPDPKIRFNLIYFINCEIYCINGLKADLFSGIEYNKETLDRFVSFFKKYFDTEVEPIETAKDIKNMT